MLQLTCRGQWVKATFSFIYSDEQIDGHAVNKRHNKRWFTVFFSGSANITLTQISSTWYPWALGGTSEAQHELAARLFKK